MNGVAIYYGDIAPEAKENFDVSVTEDLFGAVEQLSKYNLSFPNYGNPCEYAMIPLDGKTQLLSREGQSNVGIVSEQMSNADGTFDEPIVLTLESEGQYTSQGLTFTFDIYNNIYATDINIKWYRESELLDDKNFVGDSASFFARNRVENYTKIVITISAMNMPNNRLRLRVLDYGYGTVFYGDELRDVKLIQELDPLSAQISINTVDFIIDSSGDIEYDFQRKQPLSVYFNDELKATAFVKSHKRTAKFLWQVQGEDYIGLMDSVPFKGGVYSNQSVGTLMQSIFDAAKAPYMLEADLASKTVSGYIGYTTCREALMQVAFAIGAVVDTSNSATVNIYKLNDTITQKIPRERIMRGQSFDESDRVTAVELAEHRYTAIENRVEAYRASDSGTGENIFVKFSEPLYNLIITHGSILERGTNYAIIDAYTTACVLSGQTYDHVVTMHRQDNPLVLAGDVENVITIDQATLISAENVDEILDLCYNWSIRTRSINERIVEGKTVIDGGKVLYGTKLYGGFVYGQDMPSIVIPDELTKVGDAVRSETEYLGDVDGTILKQSFNLNGNIIVKDSVVKQW